MDCFNDLKIKLSPSKDYIFGSITVAGKKIDYLYNEVLTDIRSINYLVLEPLSNLSKKELNNIKKYLPDCNILNINYEQAISFLNNGYFLLFYHNIYAIEVRSNLSRGISSVESEMAIGGAKDSFSEIYNESLGLIRRRIKSSKLKVLDQNIGRYTKTKVGVLYIESICKDNLPRDIFDQLKRIDIDGILDSSYLKNALEEKHSLFPTLIMTERPDKCCMALLEGKVVILIDNSSYAIILPSFFFDFFHTTDDYFQKSIHTSFIRIIRLLAFFIAIFTPAFYIAVTTRNYSFVPMPLLLILKAGRSFVPFPAYIEAFFMILCFEILKESDFRMSSTSGSSVSILGGLILGDAAVAAGIVSPIMIIIIAISSIAALIFTSIELVNAIRIYKLFLLFLSSIFGLYGVFMGGVYMFYSIYKTNVFGYPYLYFDKNEKNDSIVLINTNIKKRNSKLTNNIIRGKYR